MIAAVDNTNAGAAKIVTLGTIETMCGRYDVAANGLDEMIAALEADLDEVKRKHLRRLKAQAGIVAQAEAELRSAVEAAPGLFCEAAHVHPARGEGWTHEQQGEAGLGH